MHYKSLPARLLLQRLTPSCAESFRKSTVDRALASWVTGQIREQWQEEWKTQREGQRPAQRRYRWVCFTFKRREGLVILNQWQGEHRQLCSRVSTLIKEVFGEHVFTLHWDDRLSQYFRPVPAYVVCYGWCYTQSRQRGNRLRGSHLQQWLQFVERFYHQVAVFSTRRVVHEAEYLLRREQSPLQRTGAV